MAELSGYEKFMRGLQCTRLDPVEIPREEYLGPKNMDREAKNVVSNLTDPVPVNIAPEKLMKIYTAPKQVVQNCMKIIAEPKKVAPTEATEIAQEPTEILSKPSKMVQESVKRFEETTKVVQNPVRISAETVKEADPQKMLLEGLKVQEPKKRIEEPSRAAPAALMNAAPAKPQTMFAKQPNVAPIPTMTMPPTKSIKVTPPECMKMFVEPAKVALEDPKQIFIEAMKVAQKSKTSRESAKVALEDTKNVFIGAMKVTQNSINISAETAKIALAKPMSLTRAEHMGWTRAEPLNWNRAEPMSWTRAEPKSWTRAEPMSWTRAEPMSWTRAEPMSWTRAEPMNWTHAEPMSWTRAEPMSWTRADPMSWNRAEPTCWGPTQPKKVIPEPKLLRAPREYIKPPGAIDHPSWPLMYDVYNFYAAHQRPGESFTSYAMRLRFLLDVCTFPISDETIRYRFVMGLLPGSVRTLLFAVELSHPMTLAKAVTFAEGLHYTSGASDEFVPPPKSLFDGLEPEPEPEVEREAVISYRPRPRYNRSAISKRRGYGRRMNRARLTFFGKIKV